MTKFTNLHIYSCSLYRQLPELQLSKWNF